MRLDIGGAQQQQANVAQSLMTISIVHHDDDTMTSIRSTQI